MPKRPPKKKGPCPRNGEHIPKGVADVKNGIITHTCDCGFSWSRVMAKPKPKPKPKPKKSWFAAAAVAVLAVAVPVAARGDTATCPSSGPVVSCVLMTDTGQAQTGLQVTDNPGPHPGTPFMVTDSNGAPMAWVNLYGLYSGGDGGTMPGGLICVTYKVSSASACLTPQGTLVLQRTGPDGPSGRPVTLTPRDIRFLHRLEAGTTS